MLFRTWMLEQGLLEQEGLLARSGRLGPAPDRLGVLTRSGKLGLLARSGRLGPAPDQLPDQRTLLQDKPLRRQKRFLLLAQP